MFQQIKNNPIKKTIALCTIGGVLELFDFMIFVFFIDVFKQVFFPNNSDFIASLQVFAIFAIGYLARPIGGVIFAHMADKHGRKKPFSLTLCFMGLPALGMAALPGFATLGIFSPILFLLLRILQGLSLGGEFPTAVTIITEHTTEKQRGFATAILSAAACIGVLLGSAVAMITHQVFSHAQLISWGWRLPFLFGALLAFFGVYLRRSMQETIYFKHTAQVIERLPIATVFRYHFPQVLRAIGIGSVISFSSFCFLFWPHFLNTYFHYPLKETLMINTIGLILLIIFTLGFGLLSFRITRDVLFRYAGLALIIFSYPLLILWDQHSAWALFLSYFCFAIFFAPVNAVYSGFIAELFPTRVCCSGVALSYNLTTALVCGSLPFIVTFACKWENPLYVMLFGLIIAGILAFACSPRKKMHKMIIDMGVVKNEG